MGGRRDIVVGKATMSDSIDLDQCNWIVQTHREERWIEIELPRKSPPTYVCMGKGELEAMLTKLQTAPVVYGLLADRRIKQLENALATVRVADADLGPGLLHGNWQMIKEARG